MKRLYPALTIALFLATSAVAATPSVAHPLQIKVPAADALRLVVDVPVASLEIANSDGGNIEITGTVTRDYTKPAQIAAAQQIADATSVRIDRVGTRAIVRREFGPASNTRSGRGSATHFTLRITVPAGMHIEVHQTAGEVALAGTFGDMQIRLRSGDVNVKVPKRTVRELIASARIGDVVTNLGDRVVTKEGLFAGKVDYLNEGGSSLLDVSVTVGDVNIQLTEH